MSTTHPDAAALWMQLVAVDPRYAQYLPIEACVLWLEEAGTRRRAHPTPYWTIDVDGDVAVLGQDAYDYARGKYDDQVVVLDGEPQPCTDTIAQYLTRFRDKNVRPVTGR